MCKTSNTTSRILFAGVLLLGGLVATVVRAATDNYETTVLSQGPAGYWRFSETAPVPNIPPTATNLGQFGPAFNGTYNGDLAGRGAPGAIAGNAGAAFDGVSEYITAPGGNNAYTTPEFTAECWFAPDGAGGTTCIMSCGDFTAARRGWLVYQTTATQFQLRTYNGINTTATAFTVNTNFVLGQYYHLLITRSNTTFRVYVNGALVSSGIPSVYAAPNNGDLFTLGIRSTPIAFPWAGKIDEAAYYTNRAPANMAKAHYDAAATNTAGYAAQIIADKAQLYFRLDEPRLTTTANLGSLGSDADGNRIYPVVAGDVGPRPAAYPGFDPANVGLVFNGAKDDEGAGGYVTVPALNLGANRVTIACWVKPNGVQEKGAGIVMHRSTLTAPSTGTTAGLIYDESGGVGYNWDGDDATTVGVWDGAVSAPVLVDNQWNFVALIVEPDKATLFVPNVDTNVVTKTHTHASLPFDGATTFGADLAKSGFKGSLDEVEIFNRALSRGEIYTQYGAAVSNTPPVIFADPQAPAGNLYAGDSLTLAVDAGGTPNASTTSVHYQWRKNTLPITDATNASYAIPSLTAGGPNSYDVVVTNQFGSLTSGSASITVLAAVAPSFTADIPVTSRTIYAGGAIKLSVQAIGGGVSYYWKHAGTNLPGVTGSSLFIDNITNVHGGTYQVIASNVVTTRASAVATITIAAPTAGSYEDIVSADQPVSWWRMDDAAPYADWMLDAMGRSDGNWSNTVTLNTSGALTNNSNKAVSFTVADQGYGQVPLPPPGTGDEFTFECWVRTSDLTTSELIPFSSFRPAYGFYFQKNTDATWRGHDGYGELDGNSSRQALIGNVTAGQWTHLVASFSTTDGHKVYINGHWDGGPYIDFARNRNTPMLIGGLDPLNLSGLRKVGSSRVDLQACKLEYSIVSPK